MADSFVMQGDLVRAIDDDQIVFEASAARRALSYWPDEAISGTKSAAFHNPPQGTAYWWSGGSSGTTPAYVERCVSYKTLRSQECGPPGIPDVTMDVTFTNILLGTVPAGTNYLDIQVRLTRTSDPDNFFDQPVRAMQPEGVWLNSQGYSFPLEKMNNLRRHIDICLDGTNVYLRRYQSTMANSNRVFDPGNDPDSNDAWTYVGGPSGTDFALLQAREIYRPTQGWTTKRGGSAQCAIDVPSITDLSSTWQVEYIVTPGRLDTSALPPVTPKPSIRFGGNTFTASTLIGTAARTWSGVNFLAAKASRYIVVQVSGYVNAGTTAPTATAVTIGGIAATKISEARNNDIGYSHSLWRALVPSGTSGTVSATWSGTTLGQSMSLFALYDLTVASPYDTASFGATAAVPSFSSLNVSVPADGVVLAVAAGIYGLFGDLAGVDDIYSQSLNSIVGTRGAMYRSSGPEQSLTAGSRSLTVSGYPSSGAKKPDAVLAASFR